MDKNRIHVSAASTERRIQNLKKLAMEKNLIRTDSTEDDVKENIAQDYKPKMTM